MSGNGKVIDMSTGAVVVKLCHICGFMIPDDIVDAPCPNAMNHFVAALPPLGVHICDTAGVAGKVGS